VKMVSTIEKTGALTPNEARIIMGDVLNKEPKLYDRDKVPFDPDIPFSLTMAEAVKGIAALGGSKSTGVLAPNQGQTPKPSGSQGADEDDDEDEEPAEKSFQMVRLDDIYTEDGEFDLSKVAHVHGALDKFLRESLHSEIEA